MLSRERAHKVLDPRFSNFVAPPLPVINDQSLRTNVERGLPVSHPESSPIKEGTLQLLYVFIGAHSSLNQTLTEFLSFGLLSMSTPSIVQSPGTYQKSGASYLINTFRYR